MTAEDVAKAVGLSRSAVEALENGRTEKPEDVRLLKVFARVLEVSQVQVLVAAGLLDEDEARGLLSADAVRNAEAALEAALQGLRQADQRFESVERDILG